jgi:hypothetical protein
MANATRRIAKTLHYNDDGNTDALRSGNNFPIEEIASRKYAASRRDDVSGDGNPSLYCLCCEMTSNSL